MPEISSNTVVGNVRNLLRLEGLAAFLVAIAVYLLTGGNPWLLAILFFAPDLSFIAYAAGPRIGAIVYNTAHSYVTPAVIAALGILFAQPLLCQLALIVAAHIGFDRAMGYGLKYAAAFNQTHLGRIGRHK